MGRKVYLSNLAEQILTIGGKPFSFSMFPPKRKIYDDPKRKQVQQTSRQVGKTTDNAALQILESIVSRNFKTLFIAPRQKHKIEYSHQRLAPLITNSPFIKRNYTGYNLVSNVNLKIFTNGSQIQLVSAFNSELPLRGPSSDFNLWDEFQSANYELFSIGQETLNRSLYKKTIVSGTPLTSISPLGKIWRKSDMKEVFFKCTHCGKWNLPSLKNIGPKFPTCEKCGKELTMDKWEMVTTGDPLAEYSGYHYNKLHLAIFKDIATNWEVDVWAKLKDVEGQGMTIAKFRNEVLGEEDDSSVRPIDIDDILACTDDSLPVPSLDELEKNSYNLTREGLYAGKLFLAIDWGTTNTVTSNTIAVLGTYDPLEIDKVVVLTAKKFVGEESDPNFILSWIRRLMQAFPNIRYIAADNGMGHAMNAMLRGEYGYDRVIGFQFVGNQNEKRKWHAVEGTTFEQVNAYFTISKVSAYDQFFQEIRERYWKFPNWKEFRTFGTEILNVQQEYNEDKNKYTYTHLPENPDDVPSTLIYLRLIIELARDV